MQDTDIVFSHWVRWADRGSLEGIGLPGVYLLAKFPTGAPDGQADPLADKIIYIGETCKALKDRLEQFHQSAFEGKALHAGGVTFRGKFRSDRGDDLYVAACPVRLDAKIRPFFIRYVERKLIWEFVQKRGKLPKCNRR